MTPLGIIRFSGLCLLFRNRNNRHTYGRRLRSAGVSFEDRQDLLGYRSGRITTHYSASELSSLLEAANSVCKDQGKYGQQEIVVLRRISSS